MAGLERVPANSPGVRLRQPGLQGGGALRSAPPASSSRTAAKNLSASRDENNRKKKVASATSPLLRKDQEVSPSNSSSMSTPHEVAQSSTSTKAIIGEILKLKHHLEARLDRIEGSLLMQSQRLKLMDRLACCFSPDPPNW